MGNANGRTDQLVRFKRETWQLMWDSGLQCILTGAETYDDGILEIINKKATIEDTIRLTYIANEYGVKIKFSFMIGLPIANRQVSMDDEFENMIDFIIIFTKLITRTTFYFLIHTISSTPLYRKSIELGYKSPNSLEAWGGFLEGLNHASTPWNKPGFGRKGVSGKFLFPIYKQLGIRHHQSVSIRH